MRKTTEQNRSNHQLALEFAQIAAADAASAELIEYLREAIAYELGTAEVTRILGISAATYSESVSSRPRKNRQFQLRWVGRILAKLSPERQLGALRIIAKPHGLAVQTPRKLTPEERARELELALLSFGDEGRRKLDEVPR